MSVLQPDWSYWVRDTQSWFFCRGLCCWWDHHICCWNQSEGWEHWCWRAYGHGWCNSPYETEGNLSTFLADIFMFILSLRLIQYKLKNCNARWRLSVWDVEGLPLLSQHPWLVNPIDSLLWILTLDTCHTDWSMEKRNKGQKLKGREEPKGWTMPSGYHCTTHGGLCKQLK